MKKILIAVTTLCMVAGFAVYSSPPGGGSGNYQAADITPKYSPPGGGSGNYPTSVTPLSSPPGGGSGNYPT